MITKCMGMVSKPTSFSRVCQSFRPILSVKEQFQDSWSGNGGFPDVRAIYEVVTTKENRAKYKQYL